jgi:hypothetical protein
MGMLVKDLIDWLDRNFDGYDGIWIDEGGLQLQGDTTTLSGVKQRLYYEVGGEPEEKDDGRV